MKASALVVATICFGISGCSVKLVAEDETPSVANTCHTSSDCGANASCDNGACVARSGSIDQVLVEVIPDSRSQFGGLSFVSTLDGVQTGDPDRAIDLPAAVSFVPQVRANLADYPNCPMDGGKQQLAARIEYTRVSSVGGVPILGLPKESVTVDVQPAVTAMNPILVDSQPVQVVSLFPGTYDIYVTPALDPSVLDSNKGCEVGPYILRGVVVEDGAPSSAPHATIDLPKPVVLDGTVVRAQGGTLVGWTLDVIEPQEGLVISTLGPVGATSMNSLTNFQTITYLPPAIAHPTTPDVASVNNPGAGSPLVRLTPPPEMLASAPTVYWELAAADINGVDANGHEKVSLDMTGVPTPDQLVEITGQVTGQDVTKQLADVGVHASLRFFSISLEGAPGITAVFNPSAVADDQGHYTIKLFPGQYRIVATPDVTTQDALAAMPAVGAAAPSGASVASPWAIKELMPVPISKMDNGPVPIALSHKIRLQGTALSDPKGAPAMGATFEAVPSILLTKVGVLRSALAQTPALPPSASVPIVDKMGAFELPVDPGAFDLSLRPADTSNFAWWVLPAKTIDLTTALVMARLPLPVPIEGSITIPDPSDPTKMKLLMLSNASVRAYAKVPDGTGVTKVGETRTDDMGHYSLGLPASFGK